MKVIDSLMSKMDADGDGRVSYAEFRWFYYLIPAQKIHSSF